MNAYRKMMCAEGGNLSWCRPYISDDGKNAIAVYEGEICGMVFNGVDVDSTEMDKPETVKAFARTVNDSYEDYSGWDDVHIALDGGVLKERSCCDCPWFDICEAMDNPDDWESDEYKDD